MCYGKGWFGAQWNVLFLTNCPIAKEHMWYSREAWRKTSGHEVVGDGYMLLVLRKHSLIKATDGLKCWFTAEIGFNKILRFPKKPVISCSIKASNECSFIHLSHVFDGCLQTLPCAAPPDSSAPLSQQGALSLQQRSRFSQTKKQTSSVYQWLGSKWILMMSCRPARPTLLMCEHCGCVWCRNGSVTSAVWPPGGRAVWLLAVKRAPAPSGLHLRFKMILAFLLTKASVASCVFEVDS